MTRQRFRGRLTFPGAKYYLPIKLFTGVRTLESPVRVSVIILSLRAPLRRAWNF